MLNVVLIPIIIALILVTVAFLFGTLLRRKGALVPTAINGVQSEILPAVANGASRNTDKTPKENDAHRIEIRSYELRNAGRDHNQRPATPIQTNHYRPATPIHQIRPITPSGGGESQRVRITSPTDVLSYRQLNELVSRVESETEDAAAAGFKTYQELTEDEQAKVANLSQCTIDVEQSVLDQVLAQINATGDGTAVQYVIGMFDKSGDGPQLTPSDKFIRHSFKIKNKKTNTFRFARLIIKDSGGDFYRLAFHDYTPYMEKYNPRFDVFKFEKGKEKSHWINMNILLHHNSERIDISHMSVLVPGSKAK